MSDTPRTDNGSCGVPLIEQLESIDKDRREMVEITPLHHRNIPYGRLCHNAATRIRQLERELGEARARVADLEANNRYQRGYAAGEADAKICIAELEKDKARLDWLESKFLHAIENKSQPSLFYTTKYLAFEGSTFEEAIDNAMKSK